MDTALTVTEQDELDVLEDVIERGLQTFVDVGTALMAIRDKRLYRADYQTFEDYCQDRWGVSSSRARRLIYSAETISNLKSVPVGTLPTNERQTRPLTDLDPDQQREVWQRAEATAPNGRITGALVEATKREYLSSLSSSDGPAGDILDSPEDSFDDWQPPTGGRNMDVHYSSETDEWETPQEFFDALDKEFRFTLDVCALSHNTKCSAYFSPEDDGLTQDWGEGVCWMNPPYKDAIKRWVAKAWQASQKGATVICLVPARTDTGWWWDHCIKGEIRFIRGRLKFGGGENSAPFPSAVVIFRGNEPSVTWWDNWRE